VSGALQTLQSVAGNDGQQSALISNLFEIFLGVTGFFYLLVILFLIWAIVRRRGGESREPLLRRSLVIWVGVVALTLGGLSIATWLTDRSLARAADRPGLQITLTGHQYWWEVRYDNGDSSKIIHTANELHLPVGVPVEISLQSGDVIHSLWIPNLSGKEDLIPGRVNSMNLLPLHPGLYRGQCAEFCGMQHANMALDVTVESPADFARWRDAQLAPPPPPPTAPLARAGYDYVTAGPCASCHNIAGTPASGQVAPDLSHVASRRSIAAGTLAMSHANLAGWVANPQGIKPGNNMPNIPLDGLQLAAITAYLETLR
jgi:cytochrome c oxidase subunit II